MIVKPKIIDDCTNRWGGIFWSNTREFLEQTNNYNQAMGLYGLEFESRWGQEIFLFSKMSRLILGKTQPSIQWVLGFFSSSKAARV